MMNMLSYAKTWLTLGVVVVTTGLASAQYCTPVYTTGTADGDYINGVTVGAIANTGSGAAITGVGYSDYTALSSDLTVGSTYTMTLDNNPSWSQTYTAWIDYDQDEVFETTEVLGGVGLSAGASGTVTFTVPVGTPGGSTRMRVRCIYPSGLAIPQDPCLSANYGEAEDYTINIVGGAANDVGVIDITNPISAVDLGFENVTITIRNYGSEPASGFNVYFQVDGGLVTGATYGGTIDAYSTASYTFGDTWDFTADGCYDITAWTDYELDEIADNDDYTETVCNLGPITGTGAWYIYSNSTGGEPWFTTTNSTAMTTVFGAEGTGWNRAFFETLDPLSIFNSDNCFVFIDGSDAQANELETFLTANMSTIENWVSSGGKLLLNSAPNEGDGMSFGFGGTTLTYSYYTSNATAVDALHPIFNGPFTPAGTDYTGTSFGHAIVSGVDLSNVMVDLFNPSAVVLAEKTWGDGRVMFGGMTTNNFHSPLTNAANLRANIIAYMSCMEFVICLPPGGLYADGITTDDAVLHWDVVDGALNYNVILQNTATGLLKKKVFATNMAVIENKLSPLTNYAFRVKTGCGVDPDIVSMASEWYYFTTLGREGVNEAAVSLYPNPNNGTFTINVAGYEGNSFNLNVVSATGQIVYTKTVDVTGANYAEQIALDNIPAGMYQVNLSNAQYQINYAIVVTK